MSCFSGPEIISTGLVLHLDAANPKSYPGSGAIWYDLSENSNHGTVNSGEYNTAKYFQNLSNTSNFFTVSINHSASISSAFSAISGGWAIEELIWTNSTNYPEADGGSVISSSAYGATATGFDWNHGMSNSSFQFGVTSSGATSYDKTIAFSIAAPFNSLNTWKLRTMLWDRDLNTVSLYINSVYQGGGSISEVQGQALYDGGGIVFGSLYGWKHYGRRSILRCYNRVLTALEIRQNFEANRSRYGI